jgi:hypothetical protein
VLAKTKVKVDASSEYSFYKYFVPLIPLTQFLLSLARVYFVFEFESLAWAARLGPRSRLTVS